MPAIKATPIANLSKPLALRDAGDPEKFSEAAERNVQEMYDMASAINTNLIPAINAAVDPLNILEANLPAVQNAAANATTASQKATAAANSATAAANSASTASAKATEAAGSATGANNAKLAAENAKTTAQGAATTATASKDAAALSATEATYSAALASTKAEEAVASASTATTSATAAITAKEAAASSATGAITAKEAAETAQTAAEAAQVAAEQARDDAHGIVTSGIPDATTTVKGLVKYGTAAGTAAQGNDSRLSNARTPLAHAHGGISNDGKVGTAEGKPLITGAGGVVQAGAFGTTTGTFCQGNDARLNKDMTWANKGTRTTAGNWTITGCIVGKPLIVVLDKNSTSTSYMGATIALVSGAIGGTPGKIAKESSFALGHVSTDGMTYSYGPDSFICIPQSTTVVLLVSGQYPSASGINNVTLTAFN